MFLVFFIKYPSSDTDIKSTMGIIENSINNLTTENVMKVYIINATAKNSENCIFINESFLENSSINFIVKGSDDSNINSKRESNKLYFDWSSPKKFYIAYYSQYNFNNTNWTGALTCQNGQVSTIINEKITIEQKISDLINDTASNYSLTKSRLGVIPKYEFNLQFEYSNKTRIGKNVTNTNANIYVKENSIQYLDSNANEKIGKMIISIW